MRRDPASTDSPLVLFDGVCNLCNATVQWILRHDRRARFRFASLQSAAARAALADAGAPGVLPDSVVLIDRDGVHTRSAAAIRVASHLGFPWWLAGIFLVVPRPVRDALYAWVARHRYTWFGKRETCMVPTPDLRARFLDADEAPASEGPRSAGHVVPATERAPGALATTAQRFGLSYLLVYVFPFPFDLIDFASAGSLGLLDSYVGVWAVVIQWVATHLLGVDASILPGGSGDTTFNYVEVLVDLALALVITLGWTAWARARPIAAMTYDRFRSLARYYLAAAMLAYGAAKVIPTQFPAPGPDRLVGAIGDMSPMGLLWTMMGASVAYQVFAGAGEMLGGLLLLARRTATLGGLVSAAVLANVVMLNLCFDVPVKLYSSHLLAIALFVVLPDLIRLGAVLCFNLPAQPRALDPFPPRRRALRAGRTVFRVLLVLIAGVGPALEGYVYLTETRAITAEGLYHGTYRVTGFTRDGVVDRANDDEVRWVRVGINEAGLGAIMRASGRSQRFGLAIDEAARTLTLRPRAAKEPVVLAFERIAGDRLRLSGRFEDATIDAVLVRENGVTHLLTDRGFHWINEFPDNR